MSEYKYNVNTLAKDVGIQPQAVRIKLRNQKVKKNKDGEYGWNSQSEYGKVRSLWGEKRERKSSKDKPAKKTVVKKRAARAEPEREAA